MTIAKIRETTTTTTNVPPVEEVWQPPLPPTDLIFDDGEPLESNRHRIAMNVLIRSLQQGYSEREDFYTSGNMFIYFSSTQAKNQDFRGPDFFAVLNVDGKKERQGWVIWEEEGRYPDVIVELTSPSTARTDRGKKKEIYEGTFRTPDYFIYDPFEANSLKGWHLGADQKYQELESNERGWLWCETLGYWLGTWEGIIDRETAVWLRFYDVEEKLVPLPEEFAQQQAEFAQQQAEFAQQQAEFAQQQAEFAQQQAEFAQQQAEFAQQQAEFAQQALEVEKQKSERLAARLRELGLELE